MEQKKNLMLLKVTLIIYAVIAIVYGLCYFFIPEKLVELSGADPIPSPWVRWAGGAIIAFGVGAIMVFRNPAKQYIFVFTLALSTLLTGLALVYAWIFEIVGTLWFTALPAILMLVVSALFWWSLFLTKEVLCPKE
jgi:hypothetical protein